MQLYDNASDIHWVFKGVMTHEQLAADPKYATLTMEPCVLYDNGEGKIYDWEPLVYAANRWGVDMTPDVEGVYDAVVKTMATPPSVTHDDIDAVHESIIVSDMAIAEAGALADANSQQVDELMMAVAEIGAMVGAN